MSIFALRMHPWRGGTCRLTKGEVAPHPRTADAHVADLAAGFLHALTRVLLVGKGMDF